MTDSIPRKRFVGRSGTNSIKSISSTPLQPKTIDPLLLATIAALLPPNYNFEIPKTIAQIKKNESNRVALQMPEGLLMYGCAIVDIIERFAQVECVIMGDVTYGACCIDDFTARALGCDMMVHYGHSCLVPVDTTTIKTLYVFVEISVDREHLAASIRLNFPHCIPSTASIGSAKGKGPELEIEIESSLSPPSLPISTLPTKLAVVGTIQFVAAVQGLKVDLEKVIDEASLLAITDGVEPSTSQLIPTRVTPTFDVTVPQIKPLSPGEILGCTAPRLAADIQAIIYVGDGRFHLESIMIANPLISAFRYDPYTKRLTRELYEHEEMRRLRGNAVELAKATLNVTKEGEQPDAWAVVLGTLGRQGNLRVLRSITRHLGPANSTAVSTTSLTSTPFIPILLSELSPAKLSLFTGISTFVQTSCPRLSIDWGYAFSKPLLSSYEASVALGVQGARGWAGMGVPTFAAAKELESDAKEDYPMDFYADNSLGDWTPRNGMGVKKTGGEKGRPMPKRRAAVNSNSVPIAV